GTNRTWPPVARQTQSAGRPPPRCQRRARSGCRRARRHPRYTLFPYTTLFRSYAQSVDYRTPDGGGGASYLELRVPAQNVKTAIADRKSTRLNSSHVKISYAVFCLKKKKKQDSRRRQLSRPQQLYRLRVSPPLY